MFKQNIQNDTKEALKSGNSFSAGVLRMLSAAIITKEKEKRYKISQEKPEASEAQLVKDSELTDEQVLEVITTEIKKRKDAIALYEQGNRLELAEREKKEIEILKNYLPEQLSPEEVNLLVQESIKNTQATTIKDMGRVMADLNPKIKGRADTSEVSKIVKESLNK